MVRGVQDAIQGANTTTLPSPFARSIMNEDIALQYYCRPNKQ